MPIPDFDDNVLPEGVHDATPEEVEARFGRFQRTDRRVRLTEKLKQYLEAARQSGIVKAVIVDGSYTTAKDDPEDVDLIAVLIDDFDWAQELRPYQSNVIDKAAVRRDFRFDLFAHHHDEPELERLMTFFALVPEKHRALTAKSH
ncbi:MAG TPA: hypothetical protein VD866_11850, partial [Urbifossiella sp.]|nr:hypothetical protein [Urbifossiella sp.]